MKRPAFQFYPAEWRKDNELRSSSIGARGLWMELCCVMHDCEPYGHLTDKSGAPMAEDAAAQLCGVERRDYRKLLAELETKGVPSRTAEGVLYSRRMVRDERLRITRAEAGSKGGNPNLLNQTDNQNSGPKDKQIPTPSSLASTASSPASINPALERTPDIDGRANGSHCIEENDEKSTTKWGTQEWVTGSALTFHMSKRTGESDRDFADRVKSEANRRRVQAQADARRHAS